MRSHSLSRARHLPLLLVATTTLLSAVVSSTYAQIGVSPSQTGMFFDDLRGKADSRNKKDQIQQGEGVYDYSDQNGYQGGAGADGSSVARDASRQIAQGYNSVGSTVYSQRQAGDYTQYSGPYQSTSTFFAPTYTSDPFLGGRRNLKLGPVNVGFGLSAMVEHNDNVNRSGTNPISDTIASTYLNISANYQVTQKSTLSLSTAIGFDHYFDHPELSPYGGDFVLNVLPGSTISLDGTIGPVYVIAYDRMAVRPGTQNDFTLNYANYFGVFENEAGFAANWAVNSRTSLSVKYSHTSDMTMDSKDPNQNFSNYDRSIDNLSASIAWSPNNVYTLGLEASYSWIVYPNKNDLTGSITNDTSETVAQSIYNRNWRNDSQTSNVGAFFVTPLGRSTSLRLSAGYQNMDFDSAPATIASRNHRDQSLTNEANLDSRIDQTHQGGFVYNATLSNQLSARISQALNFGRESSLNTVSNSITADYASYGVGIIGWSGSRLMLSSYYERTEDSFVNDEVVQNWGLDAYLSQQLTPRLRAGVGYHYGESNSSKDKRSYTQQTFNFDVNYAVSRKLSLSAGYRFFSTTAENSDFDFDQNRMILSANYNF